MEYVPCASRFRPSEYDLWCFWREILTTAGKMTKESPTRHYKTLVLFRKKSFSHCFCGRVETESRQKKAPAKGKAVEEEDPYGGSTDENTDAENEEDHPIPELPSTSALFYVSFTQTEILSFLSDMSVKGYFSPFVADFLTGKHFFLYGKFPSNERRLLTRYIVAFNGWVLVLGLTTNRNSSKFKLCLCSRVMEDYMTESVQFVVTSEGWHDSFEDVSWCLCYSPSHVSSALWQRTNRLHRRVCRFIFLLQTRRPSNVTMYSTLNQ